MPLSTAKEKLFTLYIPKKVQCMKIRPQLTLGDCKSKMTRKGTWEAGREEDSHPTKHTFI